MRYLIFAIVLLLTLSVDAEETPEQTARDNAQMYALIYNMCRGGGYAYELEPEYASQRNKACVSAADDKISEYSVRKNYATQREEAHNKRSEQLRKLNETEITKLDKTRKNAFYNSFYLDFCMEMDRKHRGKVTEGECAFIDHRILVSDWKELVETFDNINRSMQDSHTHALVQQTALDIFNKNIKLPLSETELRTTLTHSGFSCKQPNRCQVNKPVMPYKDSELTSLGGLFIGYEFISKDSMVNEVKVIMGGAGL